MFCDFLLFFGLLSVLYLINYRFSLGSLMSCFSLDRYRRNNHEEMRNIPQALPAIGCIGYHTPLTEFKPRLLHDGEPWSQTNYSTINTHKTVLRVTNLWYSLTFHDRMYVAISLPLSGPRTLKPKPKPQQVLLLGDHGLRKRRPVETGAGATQHHAQRRTASQ